MLGAKTPSTAVGRFCLVWSMFAKDRELAHYPSSGLGCLATIPESAIALLDGISHWLWIGFAAYTVLTVARGLEARGRSLRSQRLDHVDSGSPRGGYHRRDDGGKQQHQSRTGHGQQARHFQLS